MNKLNILWTTDNKETVTEMLMPYAINSRKHGWWENVNVIIWGASAKLVAADKEVQDLVREMLEHGVAVEACKACSDSFGVSGDLTGLGVSVRYMGQALTDYLKADEKVLTV